MTTAKPLTPLMLGPLETAVMTALWRSGGWMSHTVIRNRLEYHKTPAPTTIATIAGVLARKGLATRELRPGEHPSNPSTGVWWYRAAVSQEEYVGGLIAVLLLSYTPCPEASLEHALATAETQSGVRLRGATSGKIRTQADTLPRRRESVRQ